MGDGFAILDPAEVPTEPFNTCDVAHRKLTDTVGYKPVSNIDPTRGRISSRSYSRQYERLGCTELRLNQVVLEPGDVTTPHAHEGQEEVFVALTEGQIAIGAPPVGTVEDFGAYVLPDGVDPEAES